MRDRDLMDRQCRRIVVGCLIVFACLIVANVARAQTDVTISWDVPTQRVDGTALDPATDLSHYTLYCGDAEGYEIPATSADGSHSVAMADVLPEPGEYTCAMTATDTEGRESARSESAPLVWSLADPESPTNLLILTGNE